MDGFVRNFCRPNYQPMESLVIFSMGVIIVIDLLVSFYCFLWACIFCVFFTISWQQFKIVQVMSIIKRYKGKDGQLSTPRFASNW